VAERRGDDRFRVAYISIDPVLRLGRRKGRANIYTPLLWKAGYG
jgi:hypothetical protein